MALMLNLPGKEDTYSIVCVVYVYMRCALIKEWQELQASLLNLEANGREFLDVAHCRKPLPLTTVELQKQGSRFLGISSANIMKVELYEIYLIIDRGETVYQGIHFLPSNRN